LVCGDLNAGAPGGKSYSVLTSKPKINNNYCATIIFVAGQGRSEEIFKDRKRGYNRSFSFDLGLK